MISFINDMQEEFGDLGESGQAGATPSVEAESESGIAETQAADWPRESAYGSRAAVAAAEEDSLKSWWRRVHQYPLLTAAREIELARRIEAGDENAFAEMVNCNLRLVGNIARKCRRYAGGSLSLSDLVQEGNLGLIRAVRKFDHRKGFKFSTYASYWIRQAVTRSIDEQSRSIRLPVHVVETVSRTERARAILTQQLERVPTGRELAAHLHIAEHKLRDIAEKTGEPLSLDVCLSDEDDSVLSELIEDKTAPSPIDCASRSALREELERAFTCLSARESEVLTLRYGMDGSGQSRTLGEVGEHLGLTRERIRQIEKTALKRLRRFATLYETAQDELECPAMVETATQIPHSPKAHASRERSAYECAVREGAVREGDSYKRSSRDIEARRLATTRAATRRETARRATVRRGTARTGALDKASLLVSVK